MCLHDSMKKPPTDAAVLLENLVKLLVFKTKLLKQTIKVSFSADTEDILQVQEEPLRLKYKETVLSDCSRTANKV